LGVEQNLLNPLQQAPVRNKTLLDPRAPASAILNEHWQIIENLRRV
jgi:hypothetical protein